MKFEQNNKMTENDVLNVLTELELLKNKKFVNKDLSECDLNHLEFEGFNFAGADLRNVNLKNARLTDVDFTGANLIGANWQEAKRWDFDKEKYVPLTKDYVKGAILTKEDLTKNIQEKCL